MAFTEFCCRSGGSNLNSGTRTGNSTEPGTSPDFSYPSGTWVQSTLTFTRLDAGDFTVDGITVGDFVSIYPDAATVSPYVARIITVTSTTLITSTTAKMGTAPVDGTANTTATVGGAWLGPNAASSFPIGTMQATLTNAAGDPPRINFKNDATYAITAAMTHGNAGPTRWQGYTTSYNDGGKAIIDGTIVGASYTLLTSTQANNTHQDLIFANNGTTGSATGVILGTFARRLVVHNIRGHGLQMNSGMAIECETYLCNNSNTANLGGFNNADRELKWVRCISHDHSAGSNCNGWFATGQTLFLDGCISESNAGHGVLHNNTSGVQIFNSDFYNNALDGVQIGSGSGSVSVHIENSNFVKNGGYGIDPSGSTGAKDGVIINCGFGAGTQANTSGTINTSGQSGIQEVGSVIYPDDVTPWEDPADGDFRIQLLEAKETGRGSFTQTQSGYGDPSATIAYNDIGAAHHKADFPDASEVESGVSFDNGDQTGTLVSGGGSGTDDWIIGGPNG